MLHARGSERENKHYAGIILSIYNLLCALSILNLISQVLNCNYPFDYYKLLFD